MGWQWSESSPPTIEPVSLEEAKAHLRITGDEDNDYLTRVITQARVLVEKITSRRFIRRDVHLLYSPDVNLSSPLLRFPMFPVAEITEAKTVKAFSSDAEEDVLTKIEVASHQLRLSSELFAEMAQTSYLVSLSLVASIGEGTTAAQIDPFSHRALLEQIALMNEHRGEERNGATFIAPSVGAISYRAL